MTSKNLTATNSLFERVVSVLEETRSQVVRAVNTSAVLANWLIGREIVRDLQGGDERAEYGRRLIDDLSAQLTEKYGRGFSATNLKSFRLFYSVYSGTSPIRHTICAELADDQIRHTSCAQSPPNTIQHTSCVELLPKAMAHMANDKILPKFNPLLSWSHYRLLMRVPNVEARAFYEEEAAECGWTNDQLERQIKTAGLILCSDKSESVARYSVLNEGKQIFAAKYLNILPSEEELKREIAKERQLLELQRSERLKSS